MRQNFICSIFFTIFFIFFTINVFSQVTLTATSGTATGSFTTLKGAFDAINAGTHKGAIVIKINASTTETATAALNASATVSTSAPYYTSISIYPTTTGLSITGNLAAPLINLNGADNVTIDGRVNATGSTRSLTITNTSALSTAGTSTIRFINDASNNTVQHCTLKGSSTDAAAGVVFFSTTTGATGNDNNIISNNDITCAADASRPLNAIYALGTTLKNNDNNTFSNNNFYNFLSRATASQGINISSYNSTFTISGNSFYETASFTASAAVNYNVILISAATGTGNGFTVSGNYIGGSAALCAGTAWTKTAQNNAFTAISVTTATGTANSIQGNTIQNINWTNAGTAAFTAISLSGATVANIGTTTGNTIGAATGTGSITFTSTTTATDFFGINIASTDVVSCQNNAIGSITVANAATNATNFSGIYKTATAGTTTISNNTIGSSTTGSSINASSASSTAGNAQSVWGIRSAGTGTVTISGNTIANMVNATSNTTTTTAGLISGINVSAGTNTISDNEVHNLSNANTNTSVTGTASVTGIVVANATAAVQTVSGNTLYNLSNSNASFAGGVLGISYSGSTTASAVKGNFIHSLSVSGATSTTASLYGIKIDAGATTYSNNIISLGGNTKTNIYGFYQTGAASNNNSLFFNTVNIAGSLVSGATNTSYALYSTAITNTRDFRNNIFVNTRSTTSGANLHYAMYIAASGGTLTCDYNNYFVSGTGGVLGFFGAAKTALPIVTGATGNDANSIATNPTFTTTGITASDYTPTVRGAGVTGTGITIDYNGNIRGTNLSMGAIELSPGIPTISSITTTAISASVSFTVPSITGASAITTYEYSTDNGTTWVTPSPAVTTSPLMITGLASSTTYDVKLRAVNMQGIGSASASVSATTLAVYVPNEPTSLSAAAGVGSATLSFTAPSNDGNATITNYEYSLDNGVTWITFSPARIASPVIISGLTACTTYSILIRAVNIAGGGTASAPVIVTPLNGQQTGLWTARTAAANNAWSAVTYANGLFVAVAYSGTGNRVMTSPDGITWTSRTSAADNNWLSVTYGNGLFVAVANTGTGNRAMTSPDGITWTAQTTPDLSWKSITYANGLFVAVGGNGLAMTSPDGINWTQRNTSYSDNWVSVTYGNGLFVAVSLQGTAGQRVMTSPDGISWTKRTTPADLDWNSVTYANGLFVSVAGTGTGNRVMTSSDGITWTSRSSAADNNWVSVTYGNGLFVAVAAGLSSNNVMVSPDGINWSLRSTSYEARGVTYGNGVFTAVGINLAMTGADALAPSSPSIGSITTTISSASVVFTAPSNTGSSNISNYQYSLDGASTWLTRSPSSSGSPLNITGLAQTTTYPIAIRAVNTQGSGCPSNTVSATTLTAFVPNAPTNLTATPGAGYATISFMAPSNNGNATITNYEYSLDNGSTWTALSKATGTSPITVPGLATCTSYSILIRAVNIAGSGTASSPVTVTTRNGQEPVSWTPSSTPGTTLQWHGVAYGNGLFVAVNNTGGAMTSPDGVTWTSQTTSSTNYWYDITFANGLFVAVALTGTGNRVMTSPDGINWTIRASAADNQWRSITYANGLFVAVAGTGAGNLVMTSPDGINWTLRNSAANNAWTSVTFGNGLFVAVATSGLGNRVMTSPDGINWTIRNSAADNNWNSIAYGNGLFVAVAGSGTGNRVMTSTDGINWSTRNSAADYQWRKVAYGNGLFVAVSSDALGGTRSMTSRDGITWSSFPTANDNAWWGVAYANGKFVVVAGQGSSLPERAMVAQISLPPGKPEISSITPAITSVTVNFTPPADTGASAISNYEYSLNGGSSWVTPSPAVNTSPLIITGLTSITTYSIQLRAVNADGSSCPSGPVSVTTGTCTPTSSTETASDCGSYVWHGTTYTSSNNTATWTGTNAAGCDSVVTLNLTINAATSSTETASACGSYVWHGTTYTSSNNTATWTGTNAAGCDSVVTLNLTINQATSSSASAVATGSYTWNGNTYTQSGTYTWTGTNAAGCDSTVTLNLTINQIGCTATSSTETVSACGSYVWHGTTYTSSNNTATWTGTNAAGCDSVVTLHLTIRTTTSSNETVSACNSYVWHGTTYISSNNTATWTGTNAAGCDSVVTLNLTINAATSSTETVSACGSYVWHGTTYTSSNNTATWTGTNAAGCDSVVTLNLTINAATSSTETASACGSYVWHGTTYTTSGPKTWTGTNAAGCDSVVTLNLTINNATSSTETASACNSYLWHGTTYTTSGPKTWTGTNAAGCDSVVTLNLTINQATSSSASAIATGSYTWNGNTYTQSGTYTWTGTNAAGCDSTAYLSLTINAVNTNVINVCTYIGTGAELTYTANVAGAASYVWTVPTHGLIQIVTGQGTRSLKVKLLNGFALQSNKQIRVTPAGGSLQIIYLAAQAPITPAPITASSTNICNSLGTNVPIIFTIPQAYSAASYIWTAQNGTTTITHLNGTGAFDTAVAVTFNTNFTASNLTVQSVNDCGVSNIRSYTIIKDLPPTPGLISGPANACEYIGSSGQTATYTINAIATANSYTWTIPSGATNVVGQGTSSISFKYPAGFTGGSVSVTATNGCGVSNARSFAVARLFPSSPGVIDVINTSACPSRSYSYSVSRMPSNATSLYWTVPAEGTITSGQGTTSITVSYTGVAVNGNVMVTGVGNCGNSSTRITNVKLAACPTSGIASNKNQVEAVIPDDIELIAYPNPSTSNFNVNVKSVVQGAVKLNVYDLQGRRLQSIQTVANRPINMGYEWKAGVYMIKVEQGSETRTKRVVKY